MADGDWRRDQIPIGSTPCSDEDSCEDGGPCGTAIVAPVYDRLGLSDPPSIEDRPDQYGPCGLIGPGNQPITNCEYTSSVGVQAQRMVDEARRLEHQMGFRPYRVHLVWRRRDVRQVYQEIFRIELMPVKVSAQTDVSLELSVSGMRGSGGIKLTQISPLQADEHILRGRHPRISGDDVEFFYEVTRIPQCSDAALPPRNRYALGTQPHFDGKKFGWEIGIIDQDVARDDDGGDLTLEPSGYSPKIRILRP